MAKEMTESLERKKLEKEQKERELEKLKREEAYDEKKKEKLEQEIRFLHLTIMTKEENLRNLNKNKDRGIELSR